MYHAQGILQDLTDWAEVECLPKQVSIKGRISLEALEDAFQNSQDGMPSIGIPVSFSRDQIQFGGGFNKHIEDCLVLKRADFPNDYFQFIFTVRITGNMTTISFYRSGHSTLLGQKQLQEERKQSRVLIRNIMGYVSKVDDRAIDAEYDYYILVSSTIKNILGI